MVWFLVLLADVVAMSDPAYRVREAASARLLASWPHSKPALAVGLGWPDAEVADRCSKAIRRGRAADMAATVEALWRETERRWDLTHVRRLLDELAPDDELTDLLCLRLRAAGYESQMWTRWESHPRVVRLYYLSLGLHYYRDTLWRRGLLGKQE